MILAFRFIILLFVLGPTFCAFAARDSVFVNLGASDSRNNIYFDLGAGGPPVFLGDIRWLNSVARHQSNVNVYSNYYTTAVSEYIYNSVFIKPLDATSRVVGGIMLSSRSEGNSPNFHSNTIFPSGFLSYSRHLPDNQKWRYSIVLVVPDRSSRKFAIPGVGFEYEGGPGDWTLQLRFPESQILWETENTDEWGFSVSYLTKDYLLTNRKALNGEDLYVESERLLFALVTKIQLGHGLKINSKLAYSAINVLNLHNNKFKKLSLLTRNEGFYFSAGMSWGF